MSRTKGIDKHSSKGGIAKHQTLSSLRVLIRTNKHQVATSVRTHMLEGCQL